MQTNYGTNTELQTPWEDEMSEEELCACSGGISSFGAVGISRPEDDDPRLVAIDLAYKQKQYESFKATLTMVTTLFPGLVTQYPDFFGKSLGG